MKKKIGELYNKPIVTGDKNLVTKNEIHEDSLKGGSGAELIYIDFKKLYSEMYEYDNNYQSLFMCMVSTLKNSYIGTTAYGIDNKNKKASEGLMFMNGRLDIHNIQYISFSNRLFLPIDILSSSGGIEIDASNFNIEISFLEYCKELFILQDYNDTIADLMCAGIKKALDELKVTEEEVLEWLKSE